jgi:hypothetical protein
MCDGNTYGLNKYCSGKTITEEYIWQYRDPKGRHCPDKKINVSLCKRHYEWLYISNENKKREFIQGQDLLEAIGDDLCRHFNNYDYQNKVSYIYKFWLNSKTDKIILVNNDNDKNDIFDSHMIEKEYKLKGIFYYNGKHIIELSPISWEIITFQKQRQPCNQRYDYTGDNMSSIYRFVINSEAKDVSKDVSKEYYDLKAFDIEKDSVLDKWIDERSTFEECLEFINSNMSLDLDKLHDENEKEKEFIFRNTIILENVLLNTTPESNLELSMLLEKGIITLEVLWIIYVKYNHKFHSPNDEKRITENDILIDLFIKICSKNELNVFLQVAIEGCRNEVTYRMRDFYDYVNTNLYVVKYLVPKYINSKDIILSVEKIDKTKTFTPLEFWHSTRNYTWAVYGETENKYEYDKDETIREYLESLDA